MWAAGSCSVALSLSRTLPWCCCCSISAPTSSPLPVVEPSPEEWRAQLGAERAVARRHLATVLDHYHDRDWRREHQGFGVYPEDHLWRAAQGLREIEDALRD